MTAQDWSLLFQRAVDRAAEAATDAAEAAREGKLTIARDLLAEAVRHLDVAEARASRMAAPAPVPAPVAREE